MNVKRCIATVREVRAGRLIAVRHVQALGPFATISCAAWFTHPASSEKSRLAGSDFAALGLEATS